MRTFFAAILIVGTSLTGAAVAHPTNVPFQSFGECTAELHQLNKVERERVGWFFSNNGAAEVSMLNDFSCEYDPETDDQSGRRRRFWRLPTDGPLAQS